MSQTMTRASADRRLVGRCKAFMTRAGMDVTAATPNPDLDDPLSSAVEELGLTTYESGTVSDADLAAFPESLQARVLDLAEIRVLEKSLAWFVSKPARQKFFNEYEVDYSSMAESLMAYIGSKRRQYDARWMTSGAPAAGRMESDFRGGPWPSGLPWSGPWPCP